MRRRSKSRGQTVGEQALHFIASALRDIATKDIIENLEERGNLLADSVSIVDFDEIYEDRQHQG